MGGLFGGGDTPPPPPPPPAPPPAPTLDAARSNQKAQDQAVERKGRAASILTSNNGDLAPTTTGTNKLLGG